MSVTLKCQILNEWKKTIWFLKGSKLFFLRQVYLSLSLSHTNVHTHSNRSIKSIHLFLMFLFYVCHSLFHIQTYPWTLKHTRTQTHTHSLVLLMALLTVFIFCCVCFIFVALLTRTHSNLHSLIIFQSNLFFAKFYHCHLMGEIHQKDKTIFNVWHPPILTVDFLLLKRRINKTFCNTSKLAYFVYYVSCKMSLDT